MAPERVITPVMPEGSGSPDIFKHVTLEEARYELDVQPYLIGRDASASKYGLEPVIPAATFPEVTNCVDYIFGKDRFPNILEAYLWVARTHTRINVAIPGSVIFYLRQNRELRHVGRIHRGDGLIESKWGEYGSVYHHDWRLVPASYGDICEIWLRYQRM